MPPERNSLYEVNLGCATTEELINEIIARFTVSELRGGVRILSDMMEVMTTEELSYRTVDN